MILHTRQEHMSTIHAELLALLKTPPPAWLPPVHTRTAARASDSARPPQQPCPTAGADLWRHAVTLDEDENTRQAELAGLRKMKAGGPTSGADTVGPWVGPPRGSSSFVPSQYVPPSRAVPPPADMPAPPVAAAAPTASGTAAQKQEPGSSAATGPPPAPAAAPPAPAFDPVALNEAKARAAAAAQRIAASLGHGGDAAQPPSSKRPRV